MAVDGELVDALTRRNSASGADAVCDRRELDDLMDEPTEQCTWTGSNERQNGDG